MFYPARCSWEWTIKVFITLQYFARKLISWRRENYKSGFKTPLHMVTKRCNWYTLSSPLSVLDPGRNGSQLINLSWRNSSTPCGEDVFIQECRYNSSWYGTDPVNLERGGEKIKKASLTKLEAASVFNVLTVYLLSWAHKMDPWELHLFFLLEVWPVTISFWWIVKLTPRS